MRRLFRSTGKLITYHTGICGPEIVFLVAVLSAVVISFWFRLANMYSAGPNPLTNVPLEGGDIAGFWTGLFHGLTIVVTFIFSLFSDNVGIYEVHNSGIAYNIGFIIGTYFLFDVLKD